MTETMRAWAVARPGPVTRPGPPGTDLLALRTGPVPEPQAGEVLVRVTSNTRRDGERLRTLAARLRVHVRVTAYRLADPPTALRDLAAGRVTGAPCSFPT